MATANPMAPASHPGGDDEDLQKIAQNKAIATRNAQAQQQYEATLPSNSVGSYFNDLSGGVKGVTDKLGLTTSQPDLSQSPDVQNQRNFAQTLRSQYNQRPDATPLTAQTQGLPSFDELASRGGQTYAVGLEKAAAQGKAPSAAEQMFRSATDEGQKAQLATAAALQGSNPGAALRAGLSGAADVGARAASQGAALRANEMAAARDAYANAVAQQRQQDIAKTQNVAANTQNIYGQNQGYGLGLGNLALSATNAPVQASLGAQQNQLGAAQINQKGIGSVFSGAGSLLSALSDERAKKDVKPASFADALAKGVHGVTFEYKPGLEDGGAKKHFGVMAQDVEKVIPGAVEERPDGFKEVMAPFLATANTAMIAELARRVKALEGHRA